MKRLLTALVFCATIIGFAAAVFAQDTQSSTVTVQPPTTQTQTAMSADNAKVVKETTGKKVIKKRKKSRKKVGATTVQAKGTGK